MKRRHRVRGRSRSRSKRRNPSKGINREGAKVMRCSRWRHLSENPQLELIHKVSQIKTYRKRGSRSSRTSGMLKRRRERRECCKLSSQLCRRKLMPLGI